MRTEPARLASGDVISSQVTGSTDNYKIADYQWRAGDTPAGNFRTGVRHRITRPVHAWRSPSLTRSMSVSCIHITCTALPNRLPRAYLTNGCAIFRYSLI